MNNIPENKVICLVNSSVILFLNQDFSHGTGYCILCHEFGKPPIYFASTETYASSLPDTFHLQITVESADRLKLMPLFLLKLTPILML